jgi:hypothetical protein
MFVEEGFRLRFANGETIDFYADDRASKEGWMKALSEVVGRDAGDSRSKRSWADLVLSREKAEKAANDVPLNQKPSMLGPAPPAQPPRYRAGTASQPVSPMKNAGQSPVKRGTGLGLNTGAASNAPPPSPTRGIGARSPTRKPAPPTTRAPPSPTRGGATSPTRASAARAGAASPTRAGAISPTRLGKRIGLNTNKALPRLREDGAAKSGKRQAVRSMIF